MREEQLREMQTNIDKLVRKGKLKGKLIVVFGSNQPAEDIIVYLKKRNIRVDALLDNNKNKVGKTLRNVRIHSPVSLLGNHKDKAVILIASRHYKEMLGELNNMGYKEGRHVYRVVDFNECGENSLTIKTFLKRCKKAYEGKRVWERIVGEFGVGFHIFLCPTPALGDVYMACSFVEEYGRVNGIDKYVLTVTSSTGATIARMFGIENVVKLTKDESEKLTHYYLLEGGNRTRVKVFGHRNPHTNRIGDLGNYRGINFTDHFKYSICGLMEVSAPKVPIHRGSIEKASQLFESNGLKPHKTLILSPYANTASSLPEKYWKELADKWKVDGYTVCTNSANEGEPAIKGTVAINIPLKDAIVSVELAGWFIGLRSGFCDLIASANCRKTILYPDRVYQYGKMVDFFGLGVMGLCDDAEEVVMMDKGD